MIAIIMVIMEITVTIMEDMIMAIVIAEGMMQDIAEDMTEGDTVVVVEEDIVVVEEVIADAAVEVVVVEVDVVEEVEID
jgi:hypothetical protein